MLKRGLVLVITVLLATTMVMGVSAGEDAWEWQPAPKVIDIGDLHPLTGSLAMWGEIAWRGISIALDKVNSEGGINGVPLGVATEDTKGTNEGVLAAMHKLIYDRNVIFTFATDGSSNAHALNPLIKQAEVPAIFGGTAWSVRELHNPWMFGVRTNDKLNGGIMAKFMVEDLKQTKIAALYSDDAFGQGGYTETSKVLKERYGINLATAQKFSKGTKDYTAQLLSIKRSGATCIFSWCTNPEDCGIILRQVKQFGLNVAFVGGSAFGSLTITVKIAGADAEGIYAIVDYTPTNTGKWSKYLNDEMMKRFKAKADSDIQWNYDAVIVAAEALRRAGVVRDFNGQKQIMPVKQARQAIREALLTMHDFSEGVTKVYDVDENQDLAHSMAIIRVKNGQHEFVKSVEYR